MKDATRRGFLAISGAGVAAVAAAPAALAAGQPDAASPQQEQDTATTGPVLAYVHDAARGEVTVMRGEHEVVVHDPALVRSLSRHTRDLGKEA